MSETLPSPPALVPALVPHIVTVGRYRVGHLLQDHARALQGQARIEHLSASFDDAVLAVQALHRRDGIDALVAAGSSGAWLRERVDIPVVLVEVRGLDLLQALASARALAAAGPSGAPAGSAPPRIGLVSFDPPSPHIAAFNALFGAGITQFSYHGLADAQACVQAMQGQGIAAVVAPGLVADLAAQAGIPSVLIHSHSAVQQALADALLLGRHQQAERARHRRLEIVLGELPDGVVAVDEQGRIQALNTTMAVLLGAPAAQLHGRLLDTVGPPLAIAHALGAREASEDVVQLGARTLSVRRAPILEGGVLTGALVICRDPQGIQSADRHLRANQRQRSTSGARWRMEDYAGESPAVQRLRALALQCAAVDATVLIQGESGTGKELVAQGIHRASRRAAQPFLAVNCAALGESLLESELFGYEEGAFTGARRGGKTGLIEAAHTGTLFLDEVGDMPLALQSRLLRVLQEREVLRVGATTPVPVDVRVIAATHADLAAQVEKGLFRRDLYYRLAVLPLATPALRERSAQDLAGLAQALLQRHLKPTADASADADKQDSARALLAAVLAQAEGYAWPGNVRELENWIERLLACQSHVCTPQGAVDGARLREIFPECSQAPPRPPPTGTRPTLLKDTRRQAEQQRVREVLESVQGDQRQACEILGISRATLWRRLKE